MTAPAATLVRPARARFEGTLLLLVAATVAALLTVYIAQRGRADHRAPLYDWQVSAFETLTGADQAIYNALYTAREDIPAVYDDVNVNNPPGVKFHWPTPQELADYELPPFFHDRSWEQNGSLRWSLHEPLAEGEMQGSTLYLGTDGSARGQGSFLLVVGHIHAGISNNNVISIWWKPDTHAELPQSGFQDRLILQGWRAVVPYSGAQEVRRIYGADDARKVDGADADKADEIATQLFGN